MRIQRTARIYNPTLEKLEIQCNSQGFDFHPRSVTEVPEHLIDFIIPQWRHRGIFEVTEGMNADGFKLAQRQALITYIQETLDQRIMNCVRYMDMRKAQGITTDEPKQLKIARKWREELYKILEMEAPIEPVPTYETVDMGIFEGLELNKVEEVLPEPIITEMKKKRGRPAKSFTEVEVNV